MTRRITEFPPALILLLLLPTLLLWRVVFGGDVFLPADLLQDLAPWRAPHATHFIPWNPLLWDSMAEFYPWRLFASETLRQGWLPLWNPHELCGTPFVANSQSAVFYPFNLLVVILSVARAFGVSVWLHLVMTGLFMYGFLRSAALKFSPGAALLGAVTWQMSAWQVSWLALPTFLCVACWLPLALWLTWRALGEPGPQTCRAGRWAALGVCLGVLILGGHLQIAFYCLGLVFAYALFLLFSNSPSIGGRESWATLILHVLLALALTFGLAAPQVLPSLELAHVSHRAGAASLAGYTHYTALALPPLNLITLWLPGFYGNPTQGTYWGAMANGGPSDYMENACYLGILALALAFLGVAGGWKTSRPLRFFAIAAIVALLMALGTPLDALPYFGLPGFSQSASPGRILVLWTFCGAILAAGGTECLLTRTVTRKLGFGAMLAFVAVSVCAIGGTLAWISAKGPAGVLAVNLPRVGDLWRVPLGILLGAAALLWLRGRGTLPNSAAGFLLATLAAVDLLAAGYGYNHTAQIRAVYPVTPAITYLQQHLGINRVLVLNQRWSIDGHHPPQALLPPNGATAYGLNEVGGYDSLLTRRSMQFVARVDNGQDPAPLENGNMVFTWDYGSKAAQDADALYIASQIPLADPVLDLVAQQPGMYVYLNPKSQPRARGIAKGWEISMGLTDNAPTSVTVQGVGFNGGMLVVGDQWDPGWHAWENGKPVPILPHNGMFQAVPIRSPGLVTVQLRYQPDTFRAGLYLFLLALGAACGFVAAGLHRRGNR
jgi:hypothetical protein